MKELLLLLFIGHFLGDYYFQSEGDSLKKEREIKILIKHSIIYGIPYIILYLLTGLNPVFLTASIIAVLTHGIIDYGKFILNGYLRRKNPQLRDKYSSAVYISDQVLHIAVLIYISWFLGNTISFQGGITGALTSLFSITYDVFWKWILAVLLIYKPSNITFVKLFSSYKPGEINSDENSGRMWGLEKSVTLKAGAVIGFLEKFIILIFLSENQPMAAGLVLTAKSIARYDKISKSPGFAEYYLIGTLTSLLQVMLIYIAAFRIL